MDSAIRSFGEGFANRGSDALRARTEDDDLAAVLLLQLQRLFQRVGVGLIEGPLKICLFNPPSGGVDADRSIALRHLFDSDHNLHER